jgi:hypothetical protein
MTRHSFGRHTASGLVKCRLDSGLGVNTSELLDLRPPTAAPRESLGRASKHARVMASVWGVGSVHFLFEEAVAGTMEKRELEPVGHRPLAAIPSRAVIGHAAYASLRAQRRTTATR